MQVPSGSIPGLRSAAKENFERLMTCVQFCSKLFVFSRRRFHPWFLDSTVQVMCACMLFALSCQSLSFPKLPSNWQSAEHCIQQSSLQFTCKFSKCHWRSAMKSMTIAWAAVFFMNHHELYIPTHPVPRGGSNGIGFVPANMSSQDDSATCGFRRPKSPWSFHISNKNHVWSVNRV